jgi:hypothetical protein
MKSIRVTWTEHAVGMDDFRNHMQFLVLETRHLLVAGTVSKGVLKQGVMMFTGFSWHRKVPS